MAEQALAQVQRLGNGNAPQLVLESIAVPRPADDEVLVKISYVGQNPTDGEFCRIETTQLNPMLMQL